MRLPRRRQSPAINSTEARKITGHKSCGLRPADAMIRHQHSGVAQHEVAKPLGWSAAPALDRASDRMSQDIEALFAAETELLGLKLMPAQGQSLLGAYAALREMVALVGADYPMDAEPAH